MENVSSISETAVCCEKFSVLKMAPNLIPGQVLTNDNNDRKRNNHYVDKETTSHRLDDENYENNETTTDAQAMPKSETKRLRKTHIGPNVQMFFEEDPLKIVRGKRQYLYDENGLRYLDCNSNVNHVGHSHPKVAKAVYDQMLTLNVNSRFLNDKLSLYAKKLTDKFAGDLKVCYFTNSGSETNDLALQMSKAYHKGKRQVVICLEGGYHGHVYSTLKISEYKMKDGKLPLGFEDLGGKEWARIISLPDPIRGKYAHLEDEKLQCDAYVKEVENLIKTERDTDGNCTIAAFIAESIPSCAGQVIFPENYLKRIYELLRREDIICIADEVQTGFGRVGSHFWGFELYGVVPDMVSIGKPIANGYPLGALITTSKIAQSFCEGKRSYFNTFGGAPVAMAAGLAVLEIIEEEKLQENALVVGEYLKDKFNQLKKDHWMVSHVRGQGLFVGFELIRDKITMEPATAETSKLQMRLMKEERVLVNTDGKHVNVVKFKPPMCFSKQDADFAYKAIDRILREFEDEVSKREKC